jgi:4'-phosphopantetheinyl transferase EntD
MRADEQNTFPLSRSRAALEVRAGRAPIGACELTASRDPWIGDLFAPGVRTASAAPVACEDALLPAEQALVARAVAARRREFATARACARRLLAELGIEGFALLRGADRAPLWPSGIAGSISHCHDLCVVAVAPREAARSLGVDVEPDEPLERELWPRLLTGRELAGLERSEPASRGRLVRLLFSAKESVYKCVRGAGGPELGFHDVEIELAPREGGFAAAWRASRAGAPVASGALRGAFAFRGRWVFTAAQLPGEPSAAEARLGCA